MATFYECQKLLETIPAIVKGARLWTNEKRFQHTSIVTNQEPAA